ncbi:ROK family protein [Caldithrix abyssi]|nr:ROK family protein [Caldithrix abyssi]
MRIIGIDGGATKVSGGIVKRVNHNTFQLVNHVVEIQYADHDDHNPNFSPPSLNSQINGVELTDPEKRQGNVVIDCVLEVIQTLAESDQIQPAIAMPGIKTDDRRGILAIKNGPRILDFCHRVERLIGLKAPIQKLESDADMCAWGEAYGKKGHFRGIQNAYYLGGGTGTADGLKLSGNLISFDAAAPWLAKTWELYNSEGTSMETFTSMRGINQNRKDSGKEKDQTIGKMIGTLIFERIETLYSGWQGHLNSTRKIEENHPFIGSMFERIVIGQRLAEFLRSDDGYSVYQSVLMTLSSTISTLDENVKNHYLVDGQFNEALMVLSNLRSAPIIGLGAKAWMKLC